MTTGETFDVLYHRLASAWDAHQQLRRSHPRLAALTESSTRLYQARLDMSDWHRSPTARIG